MKNRFLIRSLVLGIILALILNFITLPYYVTRPGFAQDLQPIVVVEDGYNHEGKFMLTTVKMGKANIFTYLYSKWNDYYLTYPIKDILQEGETDQEYTNRQLYYMENSKETAIKIAYEKAEKEVTVNSRGVYVLRTVVGMPAENVLQFGDKIISVNGMETATAEVFMDLVAQKNVGDTIDITLVREGNEEDVSITLQPFPDDKDRAGVGIQLVTDFDVLTNPSIDIDSAKIGGPSAGLMFSLEIYNQLTEEDIAKGYQIAGTGTINEDGSVGRIGGISQKIVAAHKSGVDFFFAPNENGSENSNYLEAVKVAKDIGTKMQVIPVDTFDEAIAFLQQQQQK